MNDLDDLGTYPVYHRVVARELLNERLALAVTTETPEAAEARHWHRSRVTKRWIGVGLALCLAGVLNVIIDVVPGPVGVLISGIGLAIVVLSMWSGARYRRTFEHNARDLAGIGLYTDLLRRMQEEESVSLDEVAEHRLHVSQLMSQDPYPQAKYLAIVGALGLVAVAVAVFGVITGDFT